MSKTINISFPFVKVMVRKRAVMSKWGTHPGKLGWVFNAGKFMIATFPKKSTRCISRNLRVY